MLYAYAVQYATAQLKIGKQIQMTNMIWSSNITNKLKIRKSMNLHIKMQIKPWQWRAVP